jgi:hypothetical protein
MEYFTDTRDDLIPCNLDCFASNKAVSSDKNYKQLMTFLTYFPGLPRLCLEGDKKLHQIGGYIP